MRDIKFRAWDKENKEMLEVERLWWEQYGHKEIYIQTTQYTDYFNINEMELMQFTRTT